MSFSIDSYFIIVNRQTPRIISSNFDKDTVCSIDISKFSYTSVIFAATYNELAVYVIRKESPEKIFCLSILSSGSLTITSNGENKIELKNTSYTGGHFIVLYEKI